VADKSGRLRGGIQYLYDLSFPRHLIAQMTNVGKGYECKHVFLLEFFYIDALFFEIIKSADKCQSRDLDYVEGVCKRTASLLLLMWAPTYEHACQIYGVRRFGNKFVYGILGAERSVEFACDGGERSVRRFVCRSAAHVQLRRAAGTRRERPRGGRVSGRRRRLCAFDFELTRCPRVQRVVFKDLEHGENHFRVVAQDPKGFLRTTLEDSLRAGSAHPINHVGRHAEWDAFGDRE